MPTALDYVGSPCSWDNAVMERFFLNLKMERVWQRDYANHAEAQTDIVDYIVGFYNSVRLHSTLGYWPHELSNPDYVRDLLSSLCLKEILM